MNWTCTEAVFEDSHSFLPFEPPFYVDGELSIEETALLPVFNSLDNSRFPFYYEEIKSVNGERARVRSWFGGKERLELWIIDKEDEEKWAAIFESENIFLVVGNNDCHSFVITPDFSFFNSDGSTDYEGEVEVLKLENLKRFLKKRIRSYLFNQIH